jgi:hypothetical protein
MLQDRNLPFISHLAPFSRTGKMPVPQKNSLFVEQAGKPVHKKLIENGATSQFHPTLKFVDEYCESELTLWPSINLLRSLNLAYNL